MHVQKLSPSDYATLNLPDQWIEDEMQKVEARWIVEATKGCKRVLDLGWGSGIVAKALKADGREVVLIEGSRDFADEAIKHVDTVIVSMFEEASMADEYDCVVASFVLEHVVDPVALLRRCGTWAPKLVAVIGNANSWHRRLAVQMGLQPRLDTLSARDHAVGHYRVYDMQGLRDELRLSGWYPRMWKGLMFKPLPNSMLKDYSPELIRAMCEIELPAHEAANIGVICERV